MPQLLVLEHASDAAELPSAHISPKAVAPVRSLVESAALLERKECVAEPALEAAPPVDLEVPGVVGFHCKAHQAQPALVGFLPRVDALVPHDLGAVAGGVWAKATSKHRHLVADLRPILRACQARNPSRFGCSPPRYEVHE